MYVQLEDSCQLLPDFIEIFLNILATLVACTQTVQEAQLSQRGRAMLRVCLFVNIPTAQFFMDARSA